MRLLVTESLLKFKLECLVPKPDYASIISLLQKRKMGRYYGNYKELVKIEKKRYRKKWRKSRENTRNEIKMTH